MLAPGGSWPSPAPLRGTWARVPRPVPRRAARERQAESLAAVDRYVAALPDAESLRALAGARPGLQHVERRPSSAGRSCFESAREFFFAPLVELGPLAHWKRLAGRGDQMQDVFFFTKEAIDTYFKGRVFAVTIVGAAVSGRK